MKRHKSYTFDIRRYNGSIYMIESVQQMRMSNVISRDVRFTSS